MLQYIVGKKLIEGYTYRHRPTKDKDDTLLFGIQRLTKPARHEHLELTYEEAQELYEKMGDWLVEFRKDHHINSSEFVVKGAYDEYVGGSLNTDYCMQLGVDNNYDDVHVELSYNSVKILRQFCDYALWAYRNDNLKDVHKGE